MNAGVQVTSQMDRVLAYMADRRASDVYLIAGSPITAKIDGQLRVVHGEILSSDHVRSLLRQMFAEDQIRQLDMARELNTSVQRASGVYRVSAYVQQGTTAAVIRFIPSVIPQLSELGVPHLVLGKLVQQKRGLVLMVGATGTGKSTTLAAMLDHRNRTLGGHILTIEDPVEFVFKPNKSLFSQREVGADTESLQVALKNALRQAPDVILIGEIRDEATMTAALSYALSGHLVLATMHCNNSYHAFSRIMSLYPMDARDQVQNDLAAALKAVVSQRLVKCTDGLLAPVCEVLMVTEHIATLIRQGKFGDIRDQLEKSVTEGLQSFEQDFVRLINERRISRQEAMTMCDSPTNLQWRLQNDFTSASAAPKAPQPGDGTDPHFEDFELRV